MATSTDLQKALELRKKNPKLTVGETVSQVRQSAVPTTSTAPAPVTPPAPTPTQVTQGVNDLGGDVQNRQNTRNVMTGKGGTVTPSGATLNADGTISNPTPTPPQVTAPEVKPLETPKMEVASITTPTTTPEVKPTTIDYNKSTGREAEIQKNISEITKTNPALLKDRQAYDKAFGYATADEGKKAILDSTFQSGQPTEDVNTMFSTLRAGGSVPVTNTQAYRTAQARFNTFKKFSTFDVASLSTALSSGDLLVGTQAYNDLVSDPTTKAKIDKAQYYTTGKIDPVAIGTKQGAYVMSNSPTVATALADGYMTQEEYNSLTSNAEVTAQAKIMGEKKTEYETKKAQYDAVEDDVDKEYSGKEVTDSFKAKIVADRRKGMYKDLSIATIEYQNAMGTYTELKNSSTQLLETNMKLYEQQVKEKTDKENLLLQSQLAQQNEVFRNQLQQSNASFQTIGDKVYKVQNGQMTDTGIMAEKGTTYQAVGGKLYKIKGDQITDTGISSIAPDNKPTIQNFGTSDKPDYRQWNTKTGQWETISGVGGTGVTISPSILTPTAISTISDRLKGNNVQCGMVSNDYISQYDPKAPRMGDTLKSKIDVVKYLGVSSVPVVGGVFAMDTGSEAGHTGIITGVDLKNGTFTATDANKKGSKDGGPLETSTYKISDKTIFSNVPGTGVQSTGTQVSQDAQNYFNLIQKGTTSYEDVFKKLGGSKVGQALMNEINSLISAQGGAVPALPDSAQVKNMNSIVKTLDGLVKDPDAIENLSGFFQTSPWDAMTGKNDDTRSAIQFILKGQTLQQLIDAKAQGATFGALSNEELKMLQSSVGILSSMVKTDEDGNVTGFRGTEASVKKELKNLLDLFKEKREKMLNPGLGQSVMTLPQTSQPQTNTGVGQLSQEAQLIEQEWLNRNK